MRLLSEITLKEVCVSADGEDVIEHMLLLCRSLWLTAGGLVVLGVGGGFAVVPTMELLIQTATFLPFLFLFFSFPLFFFSLNSFAVVFFSPTFHTICNTYSSTKATSLFLI